MGGAKGRRREYNNNKNEASTCQAVNGGNSTARETVNMETDKDPGKEIPTGTVELSYAKAVINGSQSGCVFPRNLAAYLRTNQKEELRKKNVQENETRGKQNKGKGKSAKPEAAENLKKGWPEEGENNAAHIDSYKAMEVDDNITAISEEVFIQVLKQLPAPPGNLPPGKCVKEFEVDTWSLGRRTAELQKVGLILFTARKNPSRDYIKSWTQDEWECNLGIQIVQVWVLALAYFSSLWIEVCPGT
jgi:hypothetical protein